MDLQSIHWQEGIYRTPGNYVQRIKRGNVGTGGTRERDNQHDSETDVDTPEAAAFFFKMNHKSFISIYYAL